MARERWGVDVWGRRHAPHPMWQPERNVQIVAFVRAGGSQAQAAERFGVSRTRVRQILRSAARYDAA